MFAKLSVVFVALAAASSVVASPWNKPAPPAPSISQCNTNNQLCCNQLQDYDATTSSLIGLLGLSTQALQGQLGADCSPILSASGDDTCSSNPVCCSTATSNSLVGIGCSPIDSPLVAL